MAIFTTKASLKGRKFKALRLVKGRSIGDIPQMRQELQKWSDENNVKMTETASSFDFVNGQSIFKPCQSRETLGILECKSSYMLFGAVRIEYTDITLDPVYSEIETKNAKYAIHFEI